MTILTNFQIQENRLYLHMCEERQNGYRDCFLTQSYAVRLDIDGGEYVVFYSYDEYTDFLHLVGKLSNKRENIYRRTSPSFDNCSLLNEVLPILEKIKKV